MKVSIVGAGVVGSTLGAMLFEKGCEIVSITNRSSQPARALAKIVRCKKVSTSLANISPDADFLLFAVSDDALPEVVRRCSKNAKLQKMVVAHTSGVHSLDVLKPFQRHGIMVGSLHPIQSFPNTKNLRDCIKSMRGISFGVEGEGKALEMIKRIVRKLGGRPVYVPKEIKPLYHAACVFASNYVVTLLNAIAEVSGTLGFHRRWREIMLPLFTTSVENALRFSPQKALTGPIVRNDVRTIELHFKALQKFAPHLAPLYGIAGMETARVARKNGNLTTRQFQDVIRTIRQWMIAF